MGRKSYKKRLQNKMNRDVKEMKMEKIRRKEFFEEHDDAELEMTPEGPEELAAIGAGVEANGMIAEFLEFKFDNPWLARARCPTMLSELYTGKAKSYYYDFDVLSEAFLKRADISQLLSQLRLADHFRGLDLVLRNNTLSLCDLLRVELEPHEWIELDYLDKFTGIIPHPRLLKVYCIRATLDTMTNPNMYNRFNSEFWLTKQMIQYNSERVLFMQKYMRLENCWIHMLRCACILKEARTVAHTKMMDAFVYFVDNVSSYPSAVDFWTGNSENKKSKPSEHLHHCANLNCENVETTKSCQDQDPEPGVSHTMKDRRFQVCRACKAAKIRVRAYYCSIECHKEDWPVHSLFHEVLNESTVEYPVGHRRCFDE